MSTPEVDEVTLEHLEALINKGGNSANKSSTSKEKNFDTNLSSLTAAMFGIAGSIGAADEVSSYLSVFVIVKLNWLRDSLETESSRLDLIDRSLNV
jgi:hypothetical protein